MGIEYQIAQATISKNLNWRGVKELLCYRCGKRISVGDWVHRNETHFRNQRPSKKDARFYHLSCYEEMFLDV